MSNFGIFSPDEVALAQRVFNNVIQEPWFSHSRENERDCATMIMRAVQHGTDKEPELANRAKTVARLRFSNKKLSA